MADIFISYKKEDAARVIQIVEALRGQGFSVWWDHGITPGAQWDKMIQTEIDAAKAVVAVWSELSRDAPWVKEESGIGKSRGILVPVRIDPVKPPLGFGLIQVVDLVDWNGAAGDPRFAHLVQSLRSVIAGVTLPGNDAPLTRKAHRKNAFPWATTAAGAAVLVAGMAALAFTMLGSRSPTEAPGADQTLSITAPAAVSAEEKALWDDALAKRSRQAFQAYLFSHPTGAFAANAREAVAACRTDRTVTWRAAPAVYTRVMTGSQGGDTESQARANIRQYSADFASGECAETAAAGSGRNPRTKQIFSETGCYQDGARWRCSGQGYGQCTYEVSSTQTHEVCGP